MVQAEDAVRQSGGCHCGKVRFEVMAPRLVTADQCNCSICSKKAYLHWIVPRETFTLLTPKEELATYTFNTGVAKHHFCKTCGVAAFYIPRSDPDKVDVNARCVDGVDVERLTIVQFDGKNWEQNIGAYRERGGTDKEGAGVKRLGFIRNDFEIFKVEGFGPRMAMIYEHVRPKLMRLADDLAPELARTLKMEFFPHATAHRRHTVNPPRESFAAFGPSPRGYKRYPYLALCISASGVHARAVVKSEAERRPEMARVIESKAAELEKAFRGTKIARYDAWDFERLPAAVPATADFFVGAGGELAKKSGILDIGFGWPVREALALDRAEVLDAFRELEPFYRILRSVAD
jgi:uncharacterized protein YktB (UPF0637 family)